MKGSTLLGVVLCIVSLSLSPACQMSSTGEVAFSSDDRLRDPERLDERLLAFNSALFAKNYETAYALVTPQLRAAMSLEMWKRDWGLGEEAKSGPGPSARQETLEMLKSQAESGDAEAAFRVGTIYAESESPEAWAWYCQAANAGEPRSQTQLGDWHRTDIDRGHVHRGFMMYITPDDRVAFMWYSLAAQNGSLIAAVREGELSGTLTKDQVTQAEQLFRAWKPGDCPSPERRLSEIGEENLADPSFALKRLKLKESHCATDPDQRTPSGSLICSLEVQLTLEPQFQSRRGGAEEETFDSIQLWNYINGDWYFVLFDHKH